MVSPSIIVLFFLSLFIYFERVREREREKASSSGGRAEKEGERERIPNRLHIVSAEPDSGLEPMNIEVTA